MTDMAGDQQQQGGGDQQQQDGQQQGGPPEWMASLPDDLKTDATLQRYKSTEDLARGHVEARRLASSRVIVPGEGADQATRDAFYKAIGRPDAVDGYDFKLPEGQSAELADSFRAKAFELGMPKGMAEAVVAFNNEQQAAALTKYQAAAQTELDGWKQANPDHEAKLGRMKAMLTKFGADDADAVEIEARLGTGKMLDLFAKMAAATTEHQRQDGDQQQRDAVPSVEEADKAFSAKMADSAWRAKVAAGDVDATAAYDRLVEGKRQAAIARSRDPQRGRS